MADRQQKKPVRDIFYSTEDAVDAALEQLYVPKQRIKYKKEDEWANDDAVSVVLQCHIGTKRDGRFDIGMVMHGRTGIVKKIVLEPWECRKVEWKTQEDFKAAVKQALKAVVDRVGESS